ncbi:MAG TPA: hypothetical protein VIX73_29470 [Kofleriaceae bacterium]
MLAFRLAECKPQVADKPKSGSGTEVAKPPPVDKPRPDATNDAGVDPSPK